MKKIILAGLMTISLLSCKNRQVNTQKSSEESRSSSNVDQSIKSSSSTETEKMETQEQRSVTHVSSSGWKYTAPQAEPCQDPDVPAMPSGLLAPFIIVTKEGDSIDVSKMPAGSVLESTSTESTSETYLNRILQERDKRIEDLESQLKEAKSAQSKQVESIKKVETQILSWYLVFLALFVGYILPSPKTIYNIIKKLI